MAEQVVKHVAQLQAAASEKEAQAILDNLGHHLLTKTVWMINNRPHVLLEVEAYLNSKRHPDPFTHSSSNQQHGGCWYFHSKGKSFNGGTYKGLDICIGFQEKKHSNSDSSASCASSGDDGTSEEAHDIAYGGFLIRSIAELPALPTKPLHLSSLKPIEGSCCVVDHLLRCFGVASIQSLIDSHFTTRVPKLDGCSAKNESVNLKLLPLPESAASDLRVYTSPRVGLTLKRATAATQFARFLSRPYRYTTRPDIRKGRLQTVLGLSHFHNIPVPRLASLSGVKPAKALEYIAAFKAGRSKHPSKFYRIQLPIAKLCAALGACADHDSAEQAKDTKEKE